MALIHRATLTPSKLELLTAWLPSRPWAPDAEGVQQLGAYRFDDPAGEVGMESFLLQTGDGSVLHVLAPPPRPSGAAEAATPSSATSAASPATRTGRRLW